MRKELLVILDNEGVKTLNDNAQESTVALAKECGLGEEVGVRFYRNTSNIDDIWGDFHRILKDPTYSSGHTLKVILPFLKAMGADDEWLYNFAKKSLRVMPNIKEVLTDLDRRYHVRMVSTSYEFFIRAFCDSVGFDFAKARCTFVRKFNEVPISEKEKAVLLAFMEGAAQMPTIEYDGKTGEVIPEHRAYYDRFTSFIWETVYNMPVGQFLQTVHPVGQAQKREAVEQILKKDQISVKNVVGFGDSQTDLQWVQLLKGRGLSAMFNGKGKVCRESDIMYIGEDARAIKEVVDLFAERGRQGVIDYYTPFREANCGGLLAAVTPENIGELEPMSVKKRKEVRGVHIGELT